MKEANDVATRATEVYDRLRLDILNGEFEPMQPLRLETISARYGVSFTPLREALNQLRAEAMVTSSGKSGFRVAPVTLKELWETIHARILLESEALKLSFANGGTDWESDLVGALHALQTTRSRLKSDNKLSADESDEIERRHEHFHSVLLQECRSEVLLRLIDNLRTQTDRYRRPWLSRSLPETLGVPGPDEDHQALVDAALIRDADSAVGILGRHLTATGKFIQSHSEAASAALRPA